MTVPTSTSRSDRRFDVASEQSSQEAASQISRASDRSRASIAPSGGTESELSRFLSLHSTRAAISTEDQHMRSNAHASLTSREAPSLRAPGSVATWIAQSSRVGSQTTSSLPARSVAPSRFSVTTNPVDTAAQTGSGSLLDWVSQMDAARASSSTASMRPPLPMSNVAPSSSLPPRSRSRAPAASSRPNRELLGSTTAVGSIPILNSPGRVPTVKAQRRQQPVTDEQGNPILNSQGNVLTLATLRARKPVTDEQGNPILNSRGRVLTAKALRQRQRDRQPATNEQGNRIPDGRGSFLTVNAKRLRERKRERQRNQQLATDEQGVATEVTDAEVERVHSTIPYGYVRGVTEGLFQEGHVRSLDDLELYSGVPRALLGGLATETGSGDSIRLELTPLGRAFVNRYV